MAAIPERHARDYLENVGPGVTWSASRDRDVLDERTAAVLALGEHVLALMRDDPGERLRLDYDCFEVRDAMIAHDLSLGK